MCFEPPRSIVGKALPEVPAPEPTFQEQLMSYLEIVRPILQELLKYKRLEKRANIVMAELLRGAGNPWKHDPKKLAARAWQIVAAMEAAPKPS